MQPSASLINHPYILLHGHTEFAPDRSFGRIKTNYRKKFISSLFDVAEVVNESISEGGCLAEVVGLPNGKFWCRCLIGNRKL